MFRNVSGHILLRFWHFPVMTLGPGKRLGIWLQGCSIHCNGCIAPENQIFDEKFSVCIDNLMQDIEPYLHESEGITISGGEPVDQSDSLIELLQRLNESGHKDILLYSGYEKDKISGNIKALLAALIDGKFIQGLNTKAHWKGSENQTITIFREEYRNKYLTWLSENKRKMQLIRKNSNFYFIGIPEQKDLNKLQGVKFNNESD